jgi:hypothetical protein
MEVLCRMSSQLRQWYVLFLTKYYPTTSATNPSATLGNRVHRHHTHVGLVSAGGPAVDNFFLNCSQLEFRHSYDFYLGISRASEHHISHAMFKILSILHLLNHNVFLGRNQMWCGDNGRQWRKLVLCFPIQLSWS